jgi:hypothetical protein
LKNIFFVLLGPWNHVMLAGLGGYVGYNYSNWENELLVSVNGKRKEKGMPEITRESVVPQIPKAEL